MGRIRDLAGAALCVAVAASSLAQETPPPADEAPAARGEVVELKPEVPEPDRGPKAATGQRAKPKTATGSAGGLRAVSISEGGARLLVGGSERVVRPGDLIGTDLVKSIAPGRLVLERPAKGRGGKGLVIVTFDPQGRGSSLVVWAEDPTERRPREVR